MFRFPHKLLIFSGIYFPLSLFCFTFVYLWFQNPNNRCIINIFNNSLFKRALRKSNNKCKVQIGNMNVRSIGAGNQIKTFFQTATNKELRGRKESIYHSTAVKRYRHRRREFFYFSVPNLLKFSTNIFQISIF